MKRIAVIAVLIILGSVRCGSEGATFLAGCVIGSCLFSTPSHLKKAEKTEEEKQKEVALREAKENELNAARVRIQELEWRLQVETRWRKECAERETSRSR